jgi:peptidoglycan-N-acetylglucosamine deacetylase
MQARRAVAAALLIAAAVAVLLTHVSGRGVAARAGRRLEASVQPEPPRRPSAATVRADAARELLVHENEAIDRLLHRQPFITAGGSERREIALTFDDGPGPYTPRLLGELERLHVPATFFEIGFMFRWFHASAVRELTWAT